MSEGTVPSGVAPGAVPGMPAQSEDTWARPGSVPSASTTPPPPTATLNATIRRSLKANRSVLRGREERDT